MLKLALIASGSTMTAIPRPAE